MKKNDKYVYCGDDIPEAVKMFDRIVGIAFTLSVILAMLLIRHCSDKAEYSLPDKSEAWDKGE